MNSAAKIVNSFETAKRFADFLIITYIFVLFFMSKIMSCGQVDNYSISLAIQAQASASARAWW